ncbi:MAG: SDR family oxidoreductase [Marinobacter sp.]|uniref:SDR family oxidoreductase n=1 Tax=Marinobacter sp. TaxID=50741 RepID=UPI00299E6CDB|nr:SDR family oxidoreductase [Marinobacter sp.]MDX1756507.1 SDR family oxidoreductase [Marinobacter sp.]
MTTLIIGANGKIGRLLVEKCVANGMAVRAMVRHSGQAQQFEEMGAEAVMGNLEGSMDEAFRGCERVVFSAGSGPSTSPHKTLLVDLWGSIRAIEHAERQGIRQFVMVSSLKADDPLRGPEKIRHYLVARNCADDRLMRSSLDYTLLRPGRLLDEPAQGAFDNQVDWADDTNRTSVISREDVADAIVELLRHPLPSSRVIDMVSGQQPLPEFLKQYARSVGNPERPLRQ